MSQLKSLKIGIKTNTTDCENFNPDNLRQIIDGIPLL